MAKHLGNGDTKYMVPGNVLKHSGFSTSTSFVIFLPRLFALFGSKLHALYKELSERIQSERIPVVTSIDLENPSYYT